MYEKGIKGVLLMTKLTGNMLTSKWDNFINRNENQKVKMTTLVYARLALSLYSDEGSITYFIDA